MASIFDNIKRAQLLEKRNTGTLKKQSETVKRDKKPKLSEDFLRFKESLSKTQVFFLRKFAGK